jgi:hypothetical protein
MLYQEKFFVLEGDITKKNFNGKSIPRTEQSEVGAGEYAENIYLEKPIKGTGSRDRFTIFLQC